VNVCVCVRESERESQRERESERERERESWALRILARGAGAWGYEKSPRTRAPHTQPASI
jgi:hypothetical protein